MAVKYDFQYWIYTWIYISSREAYQFWHAGTQIYSSMVSRNFDISCIDTNILVFGARRLFTEKQKNSIMDNIMWTPCQGH